MNFDILLNENAKNTSTMIPWKLYNHLINTKIIVKLIKNWPKLTKDFVACVVMAALHTATTIDKEILQKPPLTNDFFSCLEI